ncbi:MAG: zinc-ribbon domain-containing protein [Thermoleophilaceae bacterium]
MARWRKSRSTSADGLVCPRCGREHAADEQFCVDCGMPLVHGGPEKVHTPLTEAEERARKIRPEYTRGEPVRVASARHQAEAEWIQNLLLEEGIPSYIRRSAGFDVPDFLAAGPRDLLVPASGAEAARELLGEANLDSKIATAPPAAQRRQAAFVAAWLVGGAALASFIAWELVRAVG